MSYAGMEPKHKKLIARKVASLLAENEATVADLPDLFGMVRENLTVSLKPEDPPSGYLHSVWILPGPKLSEDGDREGD